MRNFTWWHRKLAINDLEQVAMGEKRRVLKK
jgi:hypothetical protein